MFSGTVFVALAWLAGIAPSAVAHPGQQQAILRAHLAPVAPERNTTSPCPCESSAFEDEQEDASRSPQEWPVDCALTSAIRGALSGWLDAPPSEPLAEGLRFETSLGMARGPPARG